MGKDFEVQRWNDRKRRTAAERAPLLTGRAVGGLTIAALLGLVPLSLPAPAEAQERAEWNWEGSVPSGGTLEVRGVNGSIRVEAAPGDRAEVHAVRQGRRDDPSEVRIEVVEHSGGVTVCAVYPGSSNRCRPGGGGMQVRNNDVQVEFTVRVPAGVGVELRTVNGEVDVQGASGMVRAGTVNGSVRVEAGGRVEASSVNGNVRVMMGDLGDEEELEFSTVNGGIDITLPGSAGARVDARWVSGGFTSDRPLQVSGRTSSRRLQGTVGEGGPLLRLSTVNGEIRIR